MGGNRMGDVGVWGGAGDVGAQGTQGRMMGGTLGRGKSGQEGMWGCGDTEIWGYGDVGTWRYGDTEIWGCGDVGPSRKQQWLQREHCGFPHPRPLGSQPGLFIGLEGGGAVPASRPHWQPHRVTPPGLCPLSQGQSGGGMGEYGNDGNVWPWGQCGTGGRWGLGDPPPQSPTPQWWLCGRPHPTRATMGGLCAAP